MEIITRMAVAMMFSISSRTWANHIAADNGEEEICGTEAMILEHTHFGPFDYTNSDGCKNLEIVEKYHSALVVEQLIKGQSSAMAGDLHYILTKFPHHQRALISLGTIVSSA